MIEFEKKIIDEAIWEDVHSTDVYDIFQDPLYHYTTLDTLWKIIDGEKILARNIRFSNDSEEYYLGKGYVEDFLEKKGLEFKYSTNSDYYMICFCKEGNILSQWREYARGGVAIKFDLSFQNNYTIIKKEKDDNDSKESGILAYAKPIEVIYTQEDNYQKELFPRLEKIQNMKMAPLKTHSMIEKIFPYIKHEGFAEEKEVRLIFEVTKNNAQDVVNYLLEGGIKKPYILVKYGAQVKESKIAIYHNKKDKDIIRIIKTIKEKKGNDNIINGKNTTFNNILLEKNETIKKEEIIINNCEDQESVFELLSYHVNQYNNKNNTKIKIWCEGHLPIRKIIVGPSYNKEEVKESIARYIKDKYWMRYVDVSVSDIPYREKKSEK